MNKLLLIFLLFFLNTTLNFASDNQVVWILDNFTLIGGYGVNVYGKPTIISTELGYAMEFNALALTAPGTNNGDRIQIKGNPLGISNSEFTIEMIFKPYTTTTDFAPRVFHICRPDSMSGPRVMTLEIRSTNTWYTDFYIKSVTGSGKMGTTLYPTEQWMHMALTYKNGQINGYVNGKTDITYNGTIYTGLPAAAEVSLGGRMNNINYFKGAIRKLIFTPLALNTSQFTYDGTTGLKNIKVNRTELLQNNPNPVTNSTIISCYIATDEMIRIDVYNAMGHKVQTLVNTSQNKGMKEFVFERGILPSGIYFYTLSTASGFVQTKKMHVK